MHNSVVKQVRDVTASEFILGKIEEDQKDTEGNGSEKQRVNPNMAFKMLDGTVYKG